MFLHLSLSSCIRQTALILCGLLPAICLAQQRSQDDAKIIAEKFCTSKTVGLNIDKSKVFATSSISSSNRQTGKEAYYIYTSDSGSGFVIVSGDQRMPGILAYSDCGNFDIVNMPPAVRYWLGCYEDTYNSLEEGCSTIKQEQPCKDVLPGGVTPLLGNNLWGQDKPYNNYCPSVNGKRCVTGCVATAMSQVMNYHQYPRTGFGKVDYYTRTNRLHVTHDFSKDYFEWGKMLDSYTGVKYSEEQAKSVATLMSSCGAAVKMDYCLSAQGGSGAYQYDLLRAFVYNFSYDQDAAFAIRDLCSTKDWHQLMINELNNGRPINYAGQSLRDGGHSFVIDGYSITQGNTYPSYHVNWGWNGSCNGYYQIATLSPSENGYDEGKSGFSTDQQMTIGIKPDDGVLENKFLLCTSSLNTSKTSVSPGTNVQVYSATISNLSYRSFTGAIQAVLTNEKGNEYVFGETRLRSMEFMSEYKNPVVDISIPMDIECGDYDVRLCYIVDGCDDVLPVLSKSYARISIVSKTDVPSTPTSIESQLSCSDIGVSEKYGKEVICLGLYELQNLNDKMFVGNLRMIIADDLGNPLSFFGDSIQPGEMFQYEMLKKPVYIKGSIDDEMEDGNYRLYVGARHISSEKYSYVSLYDIAKPHLQPSELYLKMSKEAGKVTIDGHDFITIPAKLDELGQKQSVTEYYNLMGQRVYNRQKGLFITRQGKKILHE